MSCMSFNCKICCLSFPRPSKLSRHFQSRKHKIRKASLKHLEKKHKDELQLYSRSAMEDEVVRVQAGMDEDMMQDEEVMELSEHSSSRENHEIDAGRTMTLNHDSSGDSDTEEDSGKSSLQSLLLADTGHRNTSLSNSGFAPFSSKVAALLYMMLHSPRPIVRESPFETESESNLKFFIFVLQQFFPLTPSLSQLKAIQLPGYISPVKFYSQEGIPFYVNLPEVILCRCMSDRVVASMIIRYPIYCEDDDTPIKELYEAERWHNDPTYWTPMVVLTNGQHIFIGDIFEYTSIMGSCLGKVKRFIHMKNSDSLRVVFHEIVEDASTGCYLIALDDNLIISIDSIDRLSTLSFTRDGTARLSEDGTVSTLNDTEWKDFVYVHHMKKKAKGMIVMTIPLVLFCDDTSGNKSKKWNKFVEWDLIIAGMSQKQKNKLENIHFLCCSNKVSTLELVEPVVDSLLRLEDGIVMYDALLKQEVLVVAPVMFVIADNPMSSELCNHQGSMARRYCRMCMVDKEVNPGAIGKLRDKELSLQQRGKIGLQTTVKSKKEMSSKYGLRDSFNPLDKLNLDLYRSTPVESLHTILLGPTKYLLQRLMERLTPAIKDEIEVKIDTFNFSGLDGKIRGSSICRHHNSLVGGDYKIWSQIAVFIVWPYLTDPEKLVWLSLAKVFRFVYCTEMSRNRLGQLTGACTEFLDHAKAYDPTLLNKPKFHLFLHLPTCIKDFGGIASFNSERCESFNGLMRLQNLHSNRHASSCDIADRFAHIEHLRLLLHGGSSSCEVGPGVVDLADKKEVEELFFSKVKDSSKAIYQHGALRKDAKKTLSFYDIPLTSQSYGATVGSWGGNIHNEHVRSNSSVALYKAVEIWDENLCHVGKFVAYELKENEDEDEEVKFGRLTSAFRVVASNKCFCIIKRFEPLKIGEQPIMNELECPLIEETERYDIIPSPYILGCISLIHECEPECKYTTRRKTTIEREEVIVRKGFQHNNSTMYSINIYSMHYYSAIKRFSFVS